MTTTEIRAAIAYFEQLHNAIRRRGGKPNHNEIVALRVMYAALERSEI